jgi:hypothetical protein
MKKPKSDLWLPLFLSPLVASVSVPETGLSPLVGISLLVGVVTNKIFSLFGIETPVL